MNCQAIPWCFPDFSHQQQDWRFGMIQMHQPSNDFVSKKPCLFGLYRGIMLQQIYTRGLLSSYPIGIPINQPGFHGSCRTEGWEDPSLPASLLPWMTWGPVRGISLKLQDDLTTCAFPETVTTRGKGNNKLCQGKRMGVYTPTVRVNPMVFSWYSLQQFLGIINL